MRTRTRLITAVVFGSVAVLIAFMLLLWWKPNEVEKTLLAQLSPSVAYGVLWPPTLVALVLGAASGGLFAKTSRLRLGVLYAACLGFLISLPVLYTGASHFNEVIFALTFRIFDESTVPGDTAIAVFSEPTTKAVLESLIWLPGPLTGALVWALLRRPQQLKTP